MYQAEKDTEEQGCLCSASRYPVPETSLFVAEISPALPPRSDATMVVMERNGSSESNHRSNGASSVGGSSNNSNPSASDDSSSSSEDEHEPGMRVGADYQAEIPEVVHDVPAGRRGDSRQEALLVWLPNGDISDTKLDEYILLAKERYGYNTEQALGMLFWHKHNVDKSLADLPNFTPFPDEWSVEDKVLFEQAFSFHGKSFHRIRQMLPDKSISCLVKYYYQWKKTRTSTSLMDRQARKLAGGQKENESETSEPEEKTEKDKQEESPDQDKETKTPQVESVAKSICSNCVSTVSQLHTTPKGLLCNACYSFWRRTGVMRTHVGPVRNETSSHRHHPFRTKKKPPKGMYLDHDDLMALTTNQGDAIFKALDTEIINLKRQIQLNKQLLGQQRSKLFDLNDFRLTETAPRNNSRWTSEEQLIAVQAIRKYGRDYLAIAEVVGNKNAAQCRSFMVNFRRRFNLDQVLEEWEGDNNAQAKEVKTKEEAEQQTDSAPSVSTSTTQTVGAPPPLLRPAGQSPSVRPAPFQNQQRFVQPRGSLQQPPPLIRPSVAPPSGPLVRSRMPMMGPLSGPPPQLVGSQAEPTSQ